MLTWTTICCKSVNEKKHDSQKARVTPLLQINMKCSLSFIILQIIGCRHTLQSTHDETIKKLQLTNYDKLHYKMWPCVLKRLDNLRIHGK